MDTTSLQPPTLPADAGTPARLACHVLLGLFVTVATVGIPGDALQRPAPSETSLCCGLHAPATAPQVDQTSPVVSSPEDGRGSRRATPDRVADHAGGIAARLHTADGTPIAGDVFLLMGRSGSSQNARLYDRTPFTHGKGTHPETVASNDIALESVRAVTGSYLEHIELTGAPGGGPSGGVTYAIAYLNVLSNGAFTGDLRVAATGRLEHGGHLGSIDYIDAKTAAAHLAGADVLFTPTAPADPTRDTFGARFIGEIARDPHGSVTLHDPDRLEQFHRWGASRPDGMDIVDARHLIDVASYLCGAGSTYACHITNLLRQQAEQRHDRLQEQDQSESERLRAVIRHTASADAAG